ncbi:MAG: hypothetical protein LBH01_07975 [Verrucomicrobiales bacterium]|jgi:type II secretory pathway component PulJ|nr:hypothetical protein [Verrucomicrobiales bacterium]
MPSKCSRTGFTLAETLAATAALALFAFITGTCIQLVSHSTSSLPHKLVSFHNARMTARLIDKDLRQAVIGDETPLHINPASNFIELAEPVCSEGDSLFFFTNNAENGKSDLCAVGYYVVSPEGKPRELHRYFKNSDATWQTADAKCGILPHALNPAKPLFTPVAEATENEVLLSHVQSFRIRALRADTTAPDGWPPREKPALLEIVLDLVESGLTQEFKVRVPYQ